MPQDVTLTEDEMDFSNLKVRRIKVKGPDKKNYILQEAKGPDVAAFNDARSRCVRFQEGTMSAVDGQGRLEMLLVAMCLFPIDDEGNMAERSLVASDLQSWPNRVILPLFLKAKEISEIDQDDSLASLIKRRDMLTKQIEAQDPAKNAQGNSQDG
jgi:hypothetical protein